MNLLVNESGVYKVTRNNLEKIEGAKMVEHDGIYIWSGFIPGPIRNIKIDRTGVLTYETD